MLTRKRYLLPAFTLVAHYLPVANVAVTLHYFPHTSCNANTALSQYTSPAPASIDSSCHYAPDGTAAVYVDGIDHGCTVRTYGDAACTLVMGLSIGVGTCYYFGEDHRIASWKLACGSGLGADASSPEPANTTMSVTSMMSMSETTIIIGTSTDSISTAVDIVMGTVATSTNHAADHQSTITGKTPPAATTHTCSGNCTWTNQLGPTTSKQPGFQTGGPSLNINGAEQVELNGWRKHVLKGLMAMGAAEALWAFI